MATGQWPTLADVTSRMDSAGKQHLIAEMLSQAIALPEDMPFIESSEMGGHEFVFRTSIPAGAWRQINMGVPYSKSTTAKSRVGLGTLEDYSQVDRLLAEMSGDIDQFREGEDVAFLEGMGQTIEQTTWYGNTAATPAEFMGFSPFYNTVSTATAQNAANVLDGGGTGSNNLSIWLICWGVRTIFGLYPRGTKAGLAMEDKGDTVPGFDSLGNRFEAYTSWFRQMVGLCPQDWRYGARICNVDVTTAGLAGPNALDIFATIRELLLLPPHLSKGTSGVTHTDAKDEPAPGIRPIIYTNRTGRHWMDVQAMRDRNVLLRIEDYAGMPVDGINGIPIKISDQLLITEARVT
jgi:Major capsid protein GP7